MVLVNAIDQNYFHTHGPYIIRDREDEFVLVGEENGRCGISEPFTLGWAVRWYGEKVYNMKVGDKLPLSSLQ